MKANKSLFIVINAFALNSQKDLHYGILFNMEEYPQVNDPSTPFCIYERASCRAEHQPVTVSHQSLAYLACHYTRKR